MNKNSSFVLYLPGITDRIHSVVFVVFNTKPLNQYINVMELQLWPIWESMYNLLFIQVSGDTGELFMRMTDLKK